MATSGDSTLKRALMYLDERLSEGFVIVCADDGGGHSFVLRRLGPSIECPRCGRTALSSQLIDAYYERLGHVARSGTTLTRYLKSVERKPQDGDLTRGLQSG